MSDEIIIKILKVLERNECKWFDQWDIEKELGCCRLNSAFRRLREKCKNKDKALSSKFKIRNGFLNPDSEIELDERPRYYYGFF